MTHTGEIRSEFSAPRIPFEDFVKRPEWSSLPFLIQLAVLHLRRAEQQSLLEPVIASGVPPPRPRSNTMRPEQTRTSAPDRDANIASFLASIKSGGARVDAFRFAVVENKDEGYWILELTYLPTGVTRWYDLRSPGWTVAASQDFGHGKFDH